MHHAHSFVPATAHPLRSEDSEIAPPLSLLYASGRRDGRTARERGEALSAYFGLARDEYAAGYRAGYFGR